MNEYAVIRFHAFDELVGQFVLPVLIDRLVVGCFHRDAMLHAVRYNAIHGAKQAIQETGNPEMLLCEHQRLVAQGVRPKMLVCLPIVGKDGRHLFGTREILIAQPVFSCQFLAAIQLVGQLFHIHSRHLCSQFICHRLKQGSRKRLALSLLKHYLGVCQQYLHRCCSYLIESGAGKCMPYIERLFARAIYA